MINRFLILTFLVGVAAAQDVSITAGAVQTDPKQLLIQVTGMTPETFEAFFGPTGLGHKGSAYKLYVVTHPDEPEVKVDDQTTTYISPSEDTKAGFGDVTVTLRKPLLADKDQIYLVAVNGVGKKGRVVAKIDPKGNIAAVNPTRVAEQMKVTAPIPLSNKKGCWVTQHEVRKFRHSPSSSDKDMGNGIA